jgi:hypothetical protein
MIDHRKFFLCACETVGMGMMQKTQAGCNHIVMPRISLSHIKHVAPTGQFKVTGIFEICAPNLPFRPWEKVPWIDCHELVLPPSRRLAIRFTRMLVVTPSATSGTSGWLALVRGEFESSRSLASLPHLWKFVQRPRNNSGELSSTCEASITDFSFC